MTDNNRLEVTINGTKIPVMKDSYLLNAVKQAGVEIPTLCHHKDLTPNGTCRLCTCEIEINGKKKMVTACNYPIRNNISVETHSEKVKKHRKTLAEMYLGRWPNVPVIKEVAEKCGASDSEKYKSELTDLNDKACILCGHCVAACEEFAQEDILDFAGRGIKRHLAMPFNQVDPHCIGCTSCAFVCPTGAITIVDNTNKPKNPTMIRDHGMKINAEMATLDKDQCRMREVGTANIVDVMNDYDLLPVMNYKFGKHPEAYKIDSKMLKAKYFTQEMPDGCWKGCTMACAKTIEQFELKTGPYKGDKVIVEGPEYETAAASANMGCFDGDFVAEFNFYCDTYGVDTISVGTCLAFVMESYEAGVITKEDTGGKELKFGATMEALECLHEMSRGEGFGVEVGKGIKYLKTKWGKIKPEKAQFLRDIGMEVKGLEFSEYVSKESMAQQAGYSMATKGPQHDEAWLIFNDMVNNMMPSFEDKAEALHYYPLWRTWFGLNGLCKLIWNDVVPADNGKYKPQEAAKIPEHVDHFFKFFEGMTGIKLTEQKMLDQSARVYNLQRSMSVWLGKGKRIDDTPPFRAVGPVTVEEYESREKEYYMRDLTEKIGYDVEGKTSEEKLAVLRAYREDQYQKLMDSVYAKRGWTNEGVPTIARLKELGIDKPEIVEMVKDFQ